MSRTQYVPPPPTLLKVDAAPCFTVEEAAEWISHRVGPKVTATYLRNATDKHQLQCSIIAGKRHYSTEQLWAFISTRTRQRNYGKATA
jgi:hypothetical protein